MSRDESCQSPAPRIADAVARIQERWKKQPRAAIILGTGLGSLASHIRPDATIPYDQLPHFPRSTAIGHRGQFVCGELAGTQVIAMEGRFHFYEGYSAEQTTLPVRIVRQLGAELLIVSNASGGINPQFRSGDLMVMADHINLMGSRTAQLAEDARVPSRRGRASPYDPSLIELAQAVGRRHGFACHRGVYVSVLGPNYETRAEYRFMRRIGGDVVGMSTVPEVLVAAQLGMRVLALSTVTNVFRSGAAVEVDAHEVIDIAAAAEPRLRQIVLEVLKQEAREVSKQEVTERTE